MTETPLRVLVVDDTALYRRAVSNAISSWDGMEVVGTAANGRIALDQIEQLQPDLITLDVEMPVMDGLEVLRQLRAARSKVGAIMLSAATAVGADATLDALKLGALDFVPKPQGGNITENMQTLRQSLCSRIESLGRVLKARRTLRKLTESKPGLAAASSAERRAPVTRTPARNDARPIPVNCGRTPTIVTVGVSTGGPQALYRLLANIPKNLSVPVVIVQHMPPVFTKSLADDLNRRCAIPVCEAENGQTAKPGHVYIAPGGKQMKLVAKAASCEIRITDDPPENSCRPSVDYLFRSVAEVHKDGTLGVIMTGMGSDGTLGCREIKRQGGSIVAQDQGSCVVFGMPKQPTQEGLAEMVGTPEQIAAEIATRLVARKVALCQ